MTSTTLLEAAAGLLLLFFLPGYTTTRAVFPEWRLRGPEAVRRGVETATLSFALSVGWTVILGYGLLQLPGAGFRADWSHPDLEVGLALVALGGLVIGWFEGAYARDAPEGRRTSSDPGGEGAWELSRELDRLGREERRIEHRLRVSGSSADASSDALRSQLVAVREESSRLRRGREEEYAR